MKRFRAVLVAAAAVLFVLAAFTAGAAYDAFRTAIDFRQGVQLSDGNVLKAGHYDVQVILNGDGKTADFVFIQGNVVKGRHRGEARGFSAAGGGTLSPAATQIKGEDAALKIKGESNAAPSAPKIESDKEYQKNVPTLDNEKKYQKADTGAPGSARAFSWGAAGFGPNTIPKQTAGAGTLTLQLDSSNSPAAIIGVLKLVPAVQKK